ncbi:MAG: tyrosine-type recombinase/integrase [Solirubrobacteraceae bacterium]
MKASTPTLVSIQALVQDFFEKHLTVERHASRNTVLAYRDSLKLFLHHAAQQAGCSADKLEVAALDVDRVRSFLGWLEKERSSSARTRNHRLAAIKAFARYVGSVAPEYLERCRRIRELLPARFEHPEVKYLDDDEILKLIKGIDPVAERRDRALLLLLYNTGARVQEIVDLDVCDIHLDPVPVVTLEGKGRKQRTCPLWARTITALQAWLAERNDTDGPLFLNVQGRRLSRSGVAYILRKLAARAAISPRHATRISPHVIRHTTAMHLLEAGVDITTIAAWLGHTDLSTTHGYVEINLRMKQKALAASAMFPELTNGHFPEDDLLTWLAALGRPRRYAQSPPPILPTSSRESRQLHITRPSP